MKILKNTQEELIFQNNRVKSIVEKQSQSCSWSPPHLWASCFASYWGYLWFELVGPELSLTYSQMCPHW